jgi:hypothetical protein
MENEFLTQEKFKTHLFLAPRFFLDEFTPLSNPKRKIYGIYLSLLNLERQEFNKKRWLLGILPENGMLVSDIYFSCASLFRLYSGWPFFFSSRVA